MARILEFDYLHKDIVCSHVKVDFNTDEVTVTNYTDDIASQAIGKTPPTIERIEALLEERCFDRGRADLREILKAMDLPFYDPEQIVRKTHGVFMDDFYWIRFAGEDLKWKDVNIRDDG